MGASRLNPGFGCWELAFHITLIKNDLIPQLFEVSFVSDCLIAFCYQSLVWVDHLYLFHCRLHPCLCVQSSFLVIWSVWWMEVNVCAKAALHSGYAGELVVIAFVEGSMHVE